MKTKISLLVLLLGTGIACSTTKKNDDNKKDEKKLPLITKPIVKSIWIPEKIEDNIYEEGHWRHILEKPSMWSKE